MLRRGAALSALAALELGARVAATCAACRPKSSAASAAAALSRAEGAACRAAAEGALLRLRERKSGRVAWGRGTSVTLARAAEMLMARAVQLAGTGETALAWPTPQLRAALAAACAQAPPLLSMLLLRKLSQAARAAASALEQLLAQHSLGTRQLSCRERRAAGEALRGMGRPDETSVSTVTLLKLSLMLLGMSSCSREKLLQLLPQKAVHRGGSMRPGGQTAVKLRPLSCTLLELNSPCR